MQTGSNAKTVYTTNDHLGSPRINTDGIGTVISRHDYHPFGEEIARTGYGSDTIRKQFTGYERDNETDLDFAQARYFNSGFGRFSTPDPYNIILEVKVEKDPEKAKAKFNAYLTKAQQWNRYAYVINNPLVLVDPSGEVLKLTGSDDSKEKFLALLKEMLGEKAAKNLTYEVTDDNTWIIDYKKPGLAVSGEFGVALEDIIDSAKVVTMQMTTDNLMGWGGGKTDLEGNRRDIIIKISYDGMHTAEQSFRGVTGTDGKELTFTLSTMMAHELGHAWGFIRDKTGERLDKGYESTTFLKRENDDRAVQLENVERRRLGLGLKWQH